MLRALTVALLLLRACDSGASPTEGSVPGTFGKPVTLKVGETASFEGGSVELGFDSVTEDSRCPVDVQCIQAGWATLQTTLRKAGSSQALEVTGPERPAATAAGISVKVISVEPVMRSNVRIDRRGYVVAFEVTNR
jgi:hypothetical protein